MCALVQPSLYRRLLLTVAQRLSKDDVDQIVFLLEDGSVPRSEVEQISSGVGLMRSLEQHGKVAPGRYFYLLSCLRDIGRYDLASLVTQSEPAASYLPLYFQMPTQLLHLKFQTLQRKQERYLQSKQQLKAATNIEFWRSLWAAESEFYSELTANSDSIYNDGGFSEVTKALLCGIPKRLTVITDGLSSYHNSKRLKSFTKQVKACTRIGEDIISSVHCNMIDGMDPKCPDKKSSNYQSLTAITSDAHNSLCDFLADLVGEEIVKRWSKNITEDIAMTSDAITVNYPYCWDILIYIMAFLKQIFNRFLTDFHVRMEESLKLFLTEQLEVYKSVIKSNSNWISAVLHGTSVLNKLQNDGLLSDGSCVVGAPFSNTVCHMVYASLIVVVLLYHEDISPHNLQNIKENLDDLLLKKSIEYPITYSGFEASIATDFADMLDEFRDGTLIDVLGNSDETKQLIADVFHN